MYNAHCFETVNLSKLKLNTTSENPNIRHFILSNVFTLTTHCQLFYELSTNRDASNWNLRFCQLMEYKHTNGKLP